jgi:general secretion pathway protein J
MKQRGFTLIEILLSLMIFAMLGLSTYSVLNTTIQGKEAVIEQNAQLTLFQKAFAIIESDLIQFAQRKVRINGEKPSDSYFLQGEALNDSEGVGFSFVRDGWTNPLMILPRSELQFVAYRIMEENLQRLYFNYVDSDYGTEPRVQNILPGVTSISVNLLAEDNKEMDEKSLPRVIEVSFETKIYGRITRVFPIPAITEETKSKEENTVEAD